MGKRGPDKQYPHKAFARITNESAEFVSLAGELLGHPAGRSFSPGLRFLLDLAQVVAVEGWPLSETSATTLLREHLVDYWEKL